MLKEYEIALSIFFFFLNSPNLYSILGLVLSCILSQNQNTHILSFIFKIAHETEVKGQVRLQFRDITGQQCVVQRIIQATQKVLLQNLVIKFYQFLLNQKKTYKFQSGLPRLWNYQFFYYLFYNSKMMVTFSH